MATGKTTQQQREGAKRTKYIADDGSKITTTKYNQDTTDSIIHATTTNTNEGGGSRMVGMG